MVGDHACAEASSVVSMSTKNVGRTLHRGNTRDRRPVAHLQFYAQGYAPLRRSLKLSLECRFGGNITWYPAGAFVGFLRTLPLPPTDTTNPSDRQPLPLSNMLWWAPAWERSVASAIRTALAPLVDDAARVDQIARSCLRTIRHWLPRFTARMDWAKSLRICHTVGFSRFRTSGTWPCARCQQQLRFLLRPLSRAAMAAPVSDPARNAWRMRSTPSSCLRSSRTLRCRAKRRGLASGRCNLARTCVC